MFLKFFMIHFALLAGMTPGLAYSWTVTTVGTITNGAASTFFNLPSLTDLSGYSYILTTIVDTTQNGGHDTDNLTYNYSYGGTFYGTNPSISSANVTNIVTINGQTVILNNVGGRDNEQRLQTLAYGARPSVINSYNCSEGTFCPTYSRQYVISYNNPITSIDFNQVLKYAVTDADDAYSNISHYSDNYRFFYFEGRPTTISVNVPIPDVPIPAAFWLCGSALGGLVIFGKRRTTKCGTVR